MKKKMLCESVKTNCEAESKTRRKCDIFFVIAVFGFVFCRTLFTTCRTRAIIGEFKGFGERKERPHLQLVGENGVYRKEQTTKSCFLVLYVKTIQYT